jgi:hypothetical protein
VPAIHEVEFPRISIVTPSYNQRDFIEATIRSVLLQGYPNLQYIVIDGGSTDGSVDIIKKYSPWIDYWITEPDSGQSEAINKGLARCDGDWFNWLNSDDLLLPGALVAIGAAAIRHPHARIITGITQNLRDGAVFGSYSARVEHSAAAAFFHLGVNQPGAMLHLPTVREMGGVNEQLKLTMDLDLWLHVVVKHGPGCVTHIENPLAIYRYHPASKTCSGADVFALEEFAVLYDLATQYGLAATGALQRLREKAGMRTIHFPRGAQIAMAALEQSWLDRLLVSDSLLFRALLRAEACPRHACREFGALLDTLRPFLQTHFGAKRREVESRALIHAQQILGRVDARLFVRAVRSAPRANTLADIARLMLRRWRY